LPLRSAPELQRVKLGVVVGRLDAVILLVELEEDAAPLLGPLRPVEGDAALPSSPIRQPPFPRKLGIRGAVVV
jgi:hypothetical protein